jgi:hypothetical protein
MLGAAYALSFLCLLRFDEVLKIQMHHIEFILDTKIKLMLPFRKTHQFGRKSFNLSGCINHLSITS